MLQSLRPGRSDIKRSHEYAVCAGEFSSLFVRTARHHVLIELDSHLL
jgi:hypothetical protein